MNDLSALSAMENNGTFTSEFVIDPVVTMNVRKGIVGLGSGQGQSANEHGTSGLEQHQNLEAPAPAPTAHASAVKVTCAQSLDKLDLAAASGTHIPLISPRRSTRIRGGLETAMTSGGGKDAGGKSGLYRVAGGKGSANGPGNNPPHQSNSGDKENESANGRSLGRGGGGRRPPRKAGVALIESAATRRKSRRQYQCEWDLDNRPPNIFDRFFQWYYISAQWIVPGIFFVIVWLFAILLALQFFLSVPDVSGTGNDQGQDYTYRPPSQEPSNISDLVRRLLAVEKRLGYVDSRLQRQFYDGVSDLKYALSRASSHSAMASSTSVQNAKETKFILSSIKDQLDGLQKSTEQNRQNIAELERASKRADEPGPEHNRDWVTQAVQDALPSVLAATLKPDGSVEISEPFKIALHELFNIFITQKFDQELRKLNSDTIKAVPSWQSFMKDNEERLRTTISDTVDEALKNHIGIGNDTGNGVVLTSDAVILIVHDIFEEYQRQWDQAILRPLLDEHFSTFSTSFELEQNDRLSSFISSVDHQCSSIIRSATATASSVASHVAQRISAQSGGTTIQKHLGFPSKSGIQIPDYANKIAGGAVWPYLTSPSYEHGLDQSVSSWLWGHVFSAFNGRYVPHPVTAIMPTTDVGECWPFPGSYGTLAIRLSEKIYPSHVTIEHVSKLLSPDYTSAPKIVEFWVQIKNLTDRAVVESHAIRLAEKSGKKYATSRIMQHAPLSSSVHQAIDKNGREFVKLDTFEFNIEQNNAQSFALPVDMIKIGVTVNIVAFVIKENHGNEQFTCLYRVKVHGFTPEGVSGGALVETRDQSIKPVKGWW